jgi:meiotic recombination protein DMC1
MDEIDSVNSVDELQSHGIGQTDIKKLKSAGWYYVQDLFSQPRRALVGIKGISDTTADKLQAAARKLLGLDAASLGADFRTGFDIEAEQSKEIKLKTGVSDVDELLCGGLRPGLITQVRGVQGVRLWRCTVRWRKCGVVVVVGARTAQDRAVD